MIVKFNNIRDYCDASRSMDTCYEFQDTEYCYKRKCKLSGLGVLFSILLRSRNVMVIVVEEYDQY